VASSGIHIAYLKPPRAANGNSRWAWISKFPKPSAGRACWTSFQPSWTGSNWSVRSSRANHFRL